MSFEQIAQIIYLQGSATEAGVLAGATATGNGAPASVAGYNGAQTIEIRELGGGTATVVLEGTMDAPNVGSSTWYELGYWQVDATAALARSVAAIAVTASSAHVYQVLDPYYQVRARISALAGGAQVVARLYMVPA